MNIQRFNIIEVNGEKSPMEWMARQLKTFANEKYGLLIKVEIIESGTDDKNVLSSTRDH